MSRLAFGPVCSGTWYPRPWLRASTKTEAWESNRPALVAPQTRPLGFAISCSSDEMNPGARRCLLSDSRSHTTRRSRADKSTSFGDSAASKIRPSLQPNGFMGTDDKRHQGLILERQSDPAIGRDIGMQQLHPVPALALVASIPKRMRRRFAAVYGRVVYRYPAGRLLRHLGPSTCGGATTFLNFPLRQ